MGLNGRGSAGKGWPRGLRLGSEDQRPCVRVGGGQAGLGLRLVGLWAKGGSESCFYLVVVGGWQGLLGKARWASIVAAFSFELTQHY